MPAEPYSTYSILPHLPSTTANNDELNKPRNFSLEVKDSDGRLGHLCALLASSEKIQLVKRVADQLNEPLMPADAKQLVAITEDSQQRDFVDKGVRVVELLK